MSIFSSTSSWILILLIFIITKWCQCAKFQDSLNQIAYLTSSCYLTPNEKVHISHFRHHKWIIISQAHLPWILQWMLWNKPVLNKHLKLCSYKNMACRQSKSPKIYMFISHRFGNNIKTLGNGQKQIHNDWCSIKMYFALMWHRVPRQFLKQCHENIFKMSKFSIDN